MKRKFGFGFALILTLSLLLLALTACGDGECEHSYVSAVTKAPTCESDGVMTYTCSLCTDSYTVVIEALGHDYSTELQHDATHHFYKCHCGARKDEEKHISSGAATATQDEVCTECGYVITEAVGISFKTLAVNGNNVYGKVSNDTTHYSFINEVSSVGGAEYIVSKNMNGTDWLPAKTVDLAVGDNTVYIIEMINDEPSAIYTVVIRRTPIYTVTFETNGGTVVEPQYVVEGSFASSAEATCNGYTFLGWDFDFTTPITSNTIIRALWRANTDTKYTVEYYLENLDKTGYELHETNELTGTTDTTAEAVVKAFEHFTYKPGTGVIEGNINGDGSLVLKVYYTRDSYTVSNSDTSNGSITSSGSYPYGTEVKVSATAKLGYEFIGWYSENELLSAEPSYNFTVYRNIEARFAVKQEMSNFIFTSTETTCKVMGIKDKTVKEIIVPDYVTSISAGAFYNCDNLTSVTIPDSVTSIGNYAFENCTSLTSVNIGNGVTSIGNYAFYSCESLTSVNIGNGVTSIGSLAFAGCNSLTSVTIPNSVTSIGSDAFLYCDKLVEVINHSSLNIKAGSSGNGYVGYYAIEVHTGTSKVANVDGYLFYTYNGVNYLFGYVGNDTELVLPDKYNGEAYQIYKRAFYSCTSLTSVTIGNGVTSIGSSAFYDCDSLTSITIGNGVTSIDDYAFSYCDSLTSITIPNNVTSIGDYAFSYCDSLTSITIPNNVTSIGDRAFSSCTSLTSIKYHGSKAQWNAISKGSGWDYNTGDYTITYNYTGE